MSCDEVMELMQRFLDHDLTDAEQQSLFSHISTCPECALLYERLRLVDEQLMQLPAVNPPFSIVDRILPLLTEQTPAGGNQASEEEQPLKVAPAVEPAEPVQPSVVVPFRRRKLVSRLVYGTTAAAALVLGVFLFQGYEDSQSKTNNAMLQRTLTGSIVQEQSQPDQSATPEQASPLMSMNTPQNMDQMEGAENGDAPPASAGGGAPESAQTYELKAKDQFGESAGTMNSSEPLHSTEKKVETRAAQDGPESSVEFQTNLNDGFAAPPLASSETSTTMDQKTNDQQTQDKNDSSGVVMEKGGFVDPAKIDSGNRVSFVAPDPLMQSIDPQGFSPAQTEELRSANEKHDAVIEDRRVIIRSRLGEIVFLSPQQWAQTDEVHLSKWLNDNQLLYQVTHGDGTQLQYVIDIKLKQETAK
jgi:hypothetical protein